MEWFKKHKKFCIIFTLVILLLPVFFHFFVFENSFASKVSNDGWAGFFGGYIGAIIGALTTLIAITIEIEHNKNEKYIDEIISMRPYLYINKVSAVHTGGKLKVTLTIQNLGLHAACGIRVLENDQDDTENAVIYGNRFAIAANKEFTIDFCMNLDKTEYYFFDYKDIGDNFYRQEFRAVYNDHHGIKLPEHFIALEPELIQTKKEREEKIKRIRIK
ncbi:MAG: hypothetical protein E7565_08215 [Ruminococcaceae bacterium]|nr:hypothetical protein [Oscillospiraceae bacterium]